MKRQVSFLLSLILSSMLAAGCGGSKSEGALDGADAAAATPPPAAEKTAPPPLPEDVRDVAGLTKEEQGPKIEVAGEEGPAGGPVVATGELVSPVRSEVAVRLPGRVGQVFVDEGARVRRGQPLLKIETQYLALELKSAEAEVARARAAAGEAERDFKRKEELLAKESVARAAYDRSQSSYQTALASVAAAEAGREMARQRLADATLVSPITGVVAERRTDVGERLGDNSVAFVIAQTSPIKLRFQLPERYLSTLRQGQAVRATVDPYPGEVFEGRVSLVGGVVDPSTRTVAVETEFANRDGRLSPGLFARVEIDVPAARGVGNEKAR